MKDVGSMNIRRILFYRIIIHNLIFNYVFENMNLYEKISKL